MRSPYQAAAAERAKQPRERVVFTIDADAIRAFDEVAAKAGHASRAEALRSLIMKAVVNGIDAWAGE